MAPLIGELSAQLTERFSRQPLRPYGHLPYYGRHNPHGPSQAILAHQVPADEGRKTVVRTDGCSWRPACPVGAPTLGGCFPAPLIGELSAQLIERFSRQPLRPYGHLPYYGRHNPHGPSQAILARQVPTDEGRKTVVRTDSCSWRPA